MNQITQAQTLFSLHHNHKLLILPNVWDPIGARLLEAKGFPAVATASAAIAESLGYNDGEQIKLDTLLDLVARIVRSVNVPVSVDFEAGYSESIEGLRENISRLIDTGAVGLNLEDGLHHSGQLRPMVEQAKRIQAVREVAERRNLHLVINARADSFFADGFANEQERTQDAVRRFHAYVQAGADCVYPIGCRDKGSLEILRQQVTTPINVLAMAASPSLTELQEMGINRVSFGPSIFRAVLAKMSAMFDEIHDLSSYERVMTETLTGGEVHKYLRDGKEV